MVNKISFVPVNFINYVAYAIVHNELDDCVHGHDTKLIYHAVTGQSLVSKIIQSSRSQLTEMKFSIKYSIGIIFDAFR